MSWICNCTLPKQSVASKLTFTSRKHVDRKQEDNRKIENQYRHRGFFPLLVLLISEAPKNGGRDQGRRLRHASTSEDLSTLRIKESEPRSVSKPSSPQFGASPCGRSPELGLGREKGIGSSNYHLCGGWEKKRKGRGRSLYTVPPLCFPSLWARALYLVFGLGYLFRVIRSAVRLCHYRCGAEVSTGRANIFRYEGGHSHITPCTLRFIKTWHV